MILFPKLKLCRAKECLLKASRLMAEHLFLTSLVLIFVSLLFGAAVFYKYYVRAQEVEPELGKEITEFKESTYQKIIAEWQDRGERFEAAKTKAYPDPFK